MTAHGWLREEAWRGARRRGLRRLLGPDGRDRDPLRVRGAAPARSGRDRARARPRDPARRLRLPDPPADEAPLPDELAAVEGPVVLCFGLIRPYKGVDVLLDAFRAIEGAELWVVGRPLGMTARRRCASWPSGRGPGALRAPIRRRPRAARLLPPRRRRRPSLPRRRAVGRALHARWRSARRS